MVVPDLHGSGRVCSLCQVENTAMAQGVPEEAVPRKGIIRRDVLPGGCSVFVSAQGYVRSLCIKMTFVSGAVLDFGMVRSKGNVRFGNVAHVPPLVLTHLVQSADSLPAGAECFITLCCRSWI